MRRAESALMTRQLLAERRTAAAIEMDLAMEVAHRALGGEPSAREAHEADAVLARWVVDTHRQRTRRSAA